MARHDIEMDVIKLADGRQGLRVWIVDAEHEPDHPMYREPEILELKTFPAEDELEFMGFDYT